MMRPLRLLPAIVTLVLGTFTQAVAQQTFRDDFNTTHDWVAGGTGTIPAGGIWTGINNATNGSVTGGLQAVLQSNGVDGFGTPKPGVLFIEDLNSGPFGTGIGFEGTRNTAPMPYREIDSSLDFDAKVKIDEQSAGNWSAAGIVARRKGPPVGVAPLDATEQFVTAFSFRTDAANPGNANMLTKSIVNGAQVTDASIAFIPGTPAPTAPLPVYVRLLKQGTVFTSQASFDGTNWTTRTVVNNAGALAAPGGTIQIGPSYMTYGASQGTASFDFFELTTGTIPILTSSWNVAGGGNWATPTNWASQPAPGVPNSNQVEVTFGASATAAATVFTDANVTAKKLTFNNANKYAIAGTGTLTLEASTGNAAIDLQLGSHEIQAAVTLNSNLGIATVAGTRLDVNNKFNVNGRTATITGAGTVSFNNNLVTGTGGTVTNSAATIQGSGKINGTLLNSAGGTVSPGNNGLGTLSVTGTYGQVAGTNLRIELGGTGAGQFDKLVVGGAFSAAGTLNVVLVNGFTPASGNSFDILDFATASAPSLALNLPALSGGLTWNTSNLLTTGVLAVSGGVTIDADFNNDGRTDGTDLMIWQRNLGKTGVTNADGDSDGNGTVNAADLTNWRSAFGTAVAATGSVPEPASCVLLAGALAGLGIRRRR